MKGVCVLNRREIFRGRIVDLEIHTVELPNGHRVDLEIVNHPGASAIVPFIDNENVVLINQYRYAAGGLIWEIPAGKLSKGENPLDCAKRELREEVGYNAQRWIKIHEIFTSPGFCNERIHIFMATDLKPCKQHLDKDEVLSVEVIPLKKAISMILKGEIKDAKSIVGLTTAYIITTGLNR